MKYNLYVFADGLDEEPTKQIEGIEFSETMDELEAAEMGAYDIVLVGSNNPIDIQDIG